MTYTREDVGLVPEYINYVLGLLDRTFTEETEAAVKQFQGSFDRTFTIPDQDIYPDPYSVYLDSDGSILPDSLYPNGAVDINTLTDLCDIGILASDSAKISEVQRALDLPVTGTYDVETIDAIRLFQREKSLVQPIIPIKDHKNLLTNNPLDWSQGQLTSSLGTEFLELTYTSIFSPLIGVSSDPYYISKNSDQIKFVVRFYDSLGAIVGSDMDVPFTSFGSVINQPSGCTYVRVFVQVDSPQTITPDAVERLELQLELGSTATSYEPYSYNQYNTYASGKLNVITYSGLKASLGLEELI